MRDPDHGAEKRTAERLAANGYEAVFITDEVSFYDPAVGNMQVLGLSDLRSGIEIKNVSTALSENTISKHLGKSKKKRGCKVVALDISENEGLSDGDAELMIKNSLRRHNLDRALLIGHDGKVRSIYK